MTSRSVPAQSLFLKLKGLLGLQGIMLAARLHPRADHSHGPRAATSSSGFNLSSLGREVYISQRGLEHVLKVSEDMVC